VIITTAHTWSRAEAVSAVKRARSLAIITLSSLARCSASDAAVAASCA
jgi:hypothetical protein